MQQKYLVGIIILLCGVLLFLYNEKNKNIIYYFYKNNCNNSETFTKLIKNIKKITYVDVDKPEFKELIDNFNSLLYNYSNKLHSKNIYKIFYPEMVASILHYMLIISLANLFDCLDTPRLRNQPTRELEYNFIKRPNKDPAIIDYSNDMNIDLVNDAQ